MCFAGLVSLADPKSVGEDRPLWLSSPPLVALVVCLAVLLPVVSIRN